jgi:hypothetical protein
VVAKYTDDLALNKDGGPNATHLYPGADGFKIGGPEQARALNQMAGPEFFF